MEKGWEIRSKDLSMDQETIMRTGNIFQVANGYMGYRGTLDEFGPGEQVGITLAGIYDRVGDAWREPVNAPNGAYTRILTDLGELSATHAEVIHHEQVLHLRNALFRRKTKFRLHGGAAEIVSKRFLSMVNPHLMVVEYSVSAERDLDLVFQTGIDCNIWDLNGPHLESFNQENCAGTLRVSALTHELKRRIVVAESIEFKGLEQETLCSDRRILRQMRVHMAAGERITVQKFIAVVKDGDPGCHDPEKAALNLAESARKKGFERCLKEHNEAWKQLWDIADVRIEGDEEAQLGLRYSIFQLIMVAPVKGSGNSIPARALSGQVYKGAIFWDTEMFMFPFFLHTFPGKARELLEYRIRTLDGARRKAKTEGAGYRGAFYAWESQETGDEACTYFNIGDPLTGRKLRTYFRDKQIHISGDIAIAMWRYFRATGDDSLLLDGGAEVILECARFYYSYACYKPEKKRFEILDVTGPDEYHERVHNNAYTSKVAASTVGCALHSIAYLGKKDPAFLQELLKKLDFEDDIIRLKEFGERLHIPAPSPEKGLIEQFENYFLLEDTTPAEVLSRKKHPDEYLGAGQGVAVETQVIKQADVVMMLNLFRNDYSTNVKKANWEYYEPRTEHGSSLSACAYAMVAVEIGKTDWAYNYFLKTALLDLKADYKVYVGTVFMGGSHPAANGGAWMTVVEGFAGLRIEDDAVILKPVLYEKWKSLEFEFIRQGDRFSVYVSPGRIRISGKDSNLSPHTFSVDKKLAVCIPGSTIIMDY